MRTCGRLIMGFAAMVSFGSVSMANDMKADAVEPDFRCKRIAPLDMDDWDAVRETFEGIKPVGLGQHWLAEPQPELRGAFVRTAWDGETIYVYAELEDVDIFNDETEFNSMFFTKGDTFEMFMRPAVGQDAYHEIHIGPRNQKMQLRFESPGAFGTARKIADPVVESRILVDRENNRWHVVVAVPIEMIAEAVPVEKSSLWQVSFCRYDYTRTREAAVLSSTSRFTVLSFHRAHEWNLLQFE